MHGQGKTDSRCGHLSGKSIGWLPGKVVKRGPAVVCRRSVASTWLAGHLVTSSTADFTDLPPFFLNLFPEGARLQLLLESARSRDDSLELLVRVGWDTIGDYGIRTRDLLHAMQALSQLS